MVGPKDEGRGAIRGLTAKPSRAPVLSDCAQPRYAIEDQERQRLGLVDEDKTLEERTERLYVELRLEPRRLEITRASDKEPQGAKGWG